MRTKSRTALFLVVVMAMAFYPVGVAPQPATPSSQEDSLLPVVYPPKELGSPGEQACPTDGEREAAETVIGNELHSLLRERILPTLPTAGYSQDHPATSCSTISERPSGYYWIRSSDGTAVQVYCDTDRVCECGGTGGWTRVTYLNMTDPVQQCPDTWRYIASPKRTCGRTNNLAGCSSASFNTQGTNYSRICGRVIGYQFGYTGAFEGYVYNYSATIEGYYVSGVSITHRNPRQHIWSFAAAPSEQLYGPITCPCTNSFNTVPISIPPWVGSDYFCETGNSIAFIYNHHFYEDDALWDGEDCGSRSSCCQFNNPPWFCKQLPQATSDNIEVRICNTDGYTTVDTPIEFVEIYVQ